MKFIPIIVLSIFLQGCALFEKKCEEPNIPPEKVVHIDSAALEACPKLKEDLQLSSFDQFILAYGDLATNYASCANKQAGSIKLLKQFGNIKE